MKHHVPKQRLLLTLIIIFGIVFGIFGTILKYTAYRGQQIDAPGIAFGFLAMYDGTLKNLGKDAPAEVPASAEQDASAEPDAASETDKEPEEQPEPEPTPAKPEFEKVAPDYFEDALFIGDSRTDGLRLYAPFDGAEYFCTTGMSVSGCLSNAVEVPDRGTLTLEQLLDQADYGKIYIMLGINDVGGDHSVLAERFGKIFSFVREKEPDALIFVMGSLHVAKNRAKNQPMFESANIDDLNQRFGAFTDGMTSFYIDPNEIFDDAEGYLIADYTGDNVHLYAKYYEDWDNWLCTKGIVLRKPQPAADAQTGGGAQSDEGAQTGGGTQPGTGTQTGGKPTTGERSDAAEPIEEAQSDAAEQDVENQPDAPESSAADPV